MKQRIFTTKLLKDPETKLGILQIDSIKVEEGVIDPWLEGLTTEQKEAFTGLVGFFAGDLKMSLLEGYAGTGKTYLISRFLDYLMKNTTINVAMSATTNKAVKVLRTASIIDNDRVVYSTIHSLLGLKEKINNDGTITFEADKSKPRSIEDYNLVVVDETSMLDDKLFLELNNFCLYKKEFKLLFVGDGKQIPPVNSTGNSIPFDEEQRGKYKIPRFVLSEIVRQKAGNPIIECTLKLRERPRYSGLLKDLATHDWTKETGGVIIINSEDSDANNRVAKIIEKLFVNEKYKNNTDFVKIIAWRNKTVDAMNTVVREFLYGEKAPKLMLGEKLLANTTILEVNEQGIEKIIFSTNDEFEVVSFEDAEIEIRGESFKYYSTKVLCNFGETSIEKNIKILHEAEEERFKKTVQLIAERAKLLKHLPDQARATWRDFYATQRIFADVKYNYALTAHKSQGSTYENCIVLDFDITLNKELNERNKIKYTACSRAAHTLIIVS